MSLKRNNKLEEEWNKKLADSGFEDIEQTVKGERVLKQSATSIFQRTKSEFQAQQRLEYYLLVSSLCQQVKFGNFIERFVMEQYADGIKQADIKRNLLKAGIRRHRYTIHLIIKKYLREWGLSGKRIQNSRNKNKR